MSESEFVPAVNERIYEMVQAMVECMGGRCEDIEEKEGRWSRVYILPHAYSLGEFPLSTMMRGSHVDLEPEPLETFHRITKLSHKIG